ncbi:MULTISPECIES: hypothetical protein [unclassified Aeromonas]|uniref:hypothetical protein n=1 Tax=unclassified Aeromonas TaxID=257493 RepID=UPI0022E71048|nr:MULTISPECIES: hypothetical protein [unclassified Aeromonas]
MSLRCGFDTYEISDTMIVLIDRNETGLASVTNQADEVVTWLQLHLNGGIGLRRVYYRDSDGRFDELVVKGGRFASFRACPPSQQQYFRSLYYAQQESV